MQAEVDAVREQVRVGERCWRFSLDCRRNTVTAALGGASYCLRPLRWGEKRNLAHFARLGEAFLTRELVKLCLDAEVDLPRDEDELAALAALAGWITAPNAAAALPLDERLLTSVAVSVATACCWTPDELDGLRAFEVELLWAGGEQRATSDRGETAAPRDGAMRLSPAGAETTRIIIVPDPAPSPKPARTGETAARAANAASEPFALLGGSATAPVQLASVDAPPSDRTPPPSASFPAARSRRGTRAPSSAGMGPPLATPEPRQAAEAAIDASGAAAAALAPTQMRGQPRRGFARIAVKMHGAAPARAPLGTLASAHARPAQAATTDVPERFSTRAAANGPDRRACIGARACRHGAAGTRRGATLG